MPEDKKEKKDDGPTSVSEAEAEAAKAKAELDQAKEKAADPASDKKPESISDAIETSEQAVTADEAVAIAEAAYSQSQAKLNEVRNCLLYTSPSPRDGLLSRMPSSA